MEHLATVLRGLIAAHELFFLLTVLMMLDIVTGVLAAAIERQLSSNVSWNKMTRKIVTLMLVILAILVEPLAQGVPVEALACMFYIVTEGMSILENAGRAGVPLPPVLKDVLVRLRERPPNATS